jgi:hypothetical protein
VVFGFSKASHFRLSVRRLFLSEVPRRQLVTENRLTKAHEGADIPPKTQIRNPKLEIEVPKNLRPEPIGPAPPVNTQGGRCTLHALHVPPPCTALHATRCNDARASTGSRLGWQSTLLAQGHMRQGFVTGRRVLCHAHPLLGMNVPTPTPPANRQGSLPSCQPRPPVSRPSSLPATPP